MQCVFMCQVILNSNQSQEQRKYLHIYYPSYLKKNFQFSIVQTLRKIAYTKLYRTQKLINQFLDQVEYPILQSVCMLCVKPMRDMTVKMKDG